jgi:hypothetical protein
MGKAHVGVFVACSAAVLPAPTSAAGGDPPQLNERGLAGYEQFLAARDHKAFVIAPSGAWAWVGARGSEDEALSNALASRRGGRRAESWRTLFRPGVPRLVRTSDLGVGRMGKGDDPAFLGLLMFTVPR